MKKLLALIAGVLARVVTRDWALRRGFTDTVAALLAWTAGAVTSAVVLSV